MPNLGAQVPYQGASGVTPSEGVPNAKLTVQASPEDFGAQVGGAVEKAGAEGQDIAVHFANIYADSTARDTTTQQSIKLGDAEAQYHKLKGNDAAAGYKAFQQQVAQIQAEGSKGLSMAANQKYLADFSREANGAIFRAGSHAGEQAEAAQTNSFNSSIANNGNQFAINAGNPTADQYMDKGIGTQYELAHTLGHDVETADKGASATGGKYLFDAIKTMMPTNPDGAQSLADKWLNKTFSAMRPDKDGNTAEIKVPYVDADHRAAISDYLGGEYRRQEAENLTSARMFAANGDPYNKATLTSSMLRTGRSQDYINGQITHLDSMQEQFGTVGRQYELTEALKNDEAKAYSGQAVTGSYDPESVRAMFPKNPEKAEAILNQVQVLHHVAGFTSALTTQPIEKSAQDLEAFAPHDTSKAVTSDAAIDYVIDKFEGTKLATDGKGQAKFGINSVANPDLDVANLTREQAVQRYKDNYWGKNGIDADNLPENMKLPAFDTAVNFGVPQAKQMLTDAGNDPEKLAQLRRDKHESLIESDPETYGKNKEVWATRDNSIAELASHGKDYALQQQTYDAMHHSLSTYAKNLYDDPAGTIMQSDRNLTGLAQDAATDMKKLPDYVDAMMKRQEGLGIPESGRSPLSNAQASGFAGNITSSPADAPNKINQLAQASGDKWPLVYQSLVTQGKLPSYYQAVYQLSKDSQTDQYGGILARWAGDGDLKGKTETDLLGAPAVKQIKDSIQSSPDVTKLLSAFGNAGASPSQVAGYQHSIESLAYAIKFYDKTDDAKDPAAKAIELLTSKYDYMPNGGAYVPKDKMDAVSQNAQSVLNNLRSIAATPDSYNTGYHGQPNPDEYYNTLKASPTWVTSPNGDSIILMNNMGKVVMGKDKKPITVHFASPAPVSSADGDKFDPLTSL